MSNPGATGKNDCTVNIVIPIYRNLQVTRRCLNSVLASELPDNVTITVIDDASPEPDLSAYCQALADEGRVKLLVNERNQGFVATANRGFSVSPDADILLLNSDTEVAGDWVQRLQACAYTDESFGTVTPFSNNATICSYPVFQKPSPVPSLWDTASLDDLFRSANRHCHAELPTAVGFCMYIKRRCLTSVGNFDEENFGLGYGEECDFSMRAHGSGWKNVIAADVFVFHEGGVSFAAQSEELKGRADLTMQNLHPGYGEIVTQFVHDDPLLSFRRNVDHLRLRQKPGDATNIYEESIRSQSALRKRAADAREAMGAQEFILRESLEKSVWLEEQLEKYIELARCQKQELESHVELASRQKRELIGLVDIERHNKVEIESLNNFLKQGRVEFAQTDTALAETQQLVAQLNEKIDQIQQTRSWRYTAGFRKLTGSL